MYEIGLPTIVLTSKFVMTLAPIAKGDSFTIRSIYNTYLPEPEPEPEPESEVVLPEDEIDADEVENTEPVVIKDPGLSLQEVNDICSLWDSTDREDILSRFRYAEDLTEGFGHVSISSQKIESVEYSETGIEKEKSFEAIITVKAVEDIDSGSILRL